MNKMKKKEKKMQGGGSPLLAENARLRGLLQTEIGLRHAAETTIASLRRENAELRRSIGMETYFILKLPKRVMRWSAVRAFGTRALRFVSWWCCELRDVLWPPLPLESTDFTGIKKSE